MKKVIGRVVIVVAVLSVWGIVGNMDYLDQQAEVARTEEIRQQLILANADLPSLDRICLAVSNPLNHCQSKMKHEPE